MFVDFLVPGEMLARKLIQSPHIPKGTEPTYFITILWRPIALKKKTSLLLWGVVTCFPGWSWALHSTPQQPGKSDKHRAREPRNLTHELYRESAHETHTDQPAPKYHTKGCSRSSADSPGARTLVFAGCEPFHSHEFRASIARTPFCAILWRSPNGRVHEDVHGNAHKG